VSLGDEIRIISSDKPFATASGLPTAHAETVSRFLDRKLSNSDTNEERYCHTRFPFVVRGQAK
jgi:hypothetical protein